MRGRLQRPRRPPQKLEDLEIPLAYWGQEEKECPACHKVIQAAALRCRHCGAVFSSARPQGAGEFQATKVMEGDAVSLRKTAVWLLVFSVLPCTSPIAAVAGWVWYASKRERIAALPARQSAVAKIALAVSTFQTVLLIAVVVLHGLFGSDTLVR